LSGNRKVAGSIAGLLPLLAKCGGVPAAVESRRPRREERTQSPAKRQNAPSTRREWKN